MKVSFVWDVIYRSFGVFLQCPQRLSIAEGVIIAPCQPILKPNWNTKVEDKNKCLIALRPAGYTA